MYKLKENPIGLYEKALPENLPWAEKIQSAKELGFDFLELSVDESESRSTRLNWTKEERKELRNTLFENGMYLNSMCLSLHRKIPFGSADPTIQKQSLEIMEKALELAYDLGIRTIQLAGYDVYYEESTKETHINFLNNLKKATRMAESCNVNLAIEIMDTPYINNLFKFRDISTQIKSNHLFAYPDVGNISGWNGSVEKNMRYGKDDIIAIHLKDTYKVSNQHPKGQFRDLTIGTGEVDFKEVFTTLKEINYNGPMVLELWANDNPNYMDNIQNSLNHIKTQAKLVGFNSIL